MRTDDFIALLSADNAVARTESSRARRVGLVLVAAAAGLAAAWFVGIYGVRTGIGEQGVLAATLRKEMVTVLAAAAGLLAAWTLSTPVPGRVRWWLAPLLLLAALVAWEVAAVGGAGWQVRLMGRNALACLAMIPVISALPFIAIVFALRSRAPASPVRAGAAAGLAAAGIGASVYALHCTDDSMLFVAAWYGLASAILMLAGAAAGWRWLRW